MGKPFWRSVEYFFTGNYSADQGNNTIVAIGFGGQIHAYGGDDHISLGSIGATVHTGSGDDTVVGGSAYLKINDSSGHLKVQGAAGYADINKSGAGNVSFSGAAGAASIDHNGEIGSLDYQGLAAYNELNRLGKQGEISFSGAGGYNRLNHQTNAGSMEFIGAGAGNKLTRTWFDQYQESHGDINFSGAGVANSIYSSIEEGSIHFSGAGADNYLVRKGKQGDITLRGAGASNRIERTRNAQDNYSQTQGHILFQGVGAYNHLYSDVAHGDIHFDGVGGYNNIVRQGRGQKVAQSSIEFANADNVAFGNATIKGKWITTARQVKPLKSEVESNTYLFAILEDGFTKVNKVVLDNDPVSGQLNYLSTSWYREGNHINNLTNTQVSEQSGFTAVALKGAYALFDLSVERQQNFEIHAIEKNLTEYEWVTYGGGTLVEAADITLSDAKMGGYSIGNPVDVKAIKSLKKPNAYIYAVWTGKHTKIVEVELINDEKTGVLKYYASAWYKVGNFTDNIQNEVYSTANGYRSMAKGGYSLSDLQYSVKASRVDSERIPNLSDKKTLPLIPSNNADSESSGDVHFKGAGAGNVIRSDVTEGDVHFSGIGAANIISHHSLIGDTYFVGGGGANVIVKSGREGNLSFKGAGLANVIVNSSSSGMMDVEAGGALNVLIKVGNGDYLAHLLAYGNISIHKGDGDSNLMLFGGFNSHTQIGSGKGLWVAGGGFNILTQIGDGDINSIMLGGANVLTKLGAGDLNVGMLGGGNILTHLSKDDAPNNTKFIAFGGANVLTKKGNGDVTAIMAGGANVLTHVGNGSTTGIQLGGANILTKVGDGKMTGIMFGIGNVLTHVGSGKTLGVMAGAGNIFTKVGQGTSIAAMIGAGNVLTHIGKGNTWALMGGMGNIFTKVGDGDALALMIAEANVFTHIGNGLTIALMLAKGNIATKVGNGPTLGAMIGNVNVFTHIGDGATFAAMIGQANVMTKVGDELTASLMFGKANISTHVGNGTSIGVFAGELNVMTKVGDGTTLAAMFGKANIMTHVGNGLTGVLALGEANLVTKVGNGFMGVVAASRANVITHVGDATTAAVLAGKGNILTKVGDGTAVGLLISDVGNVMTHVGDGTTLGFAKGKVNLITKIGDGLGVNAVWGTANVLTHIGEGDRYNLAKGRANIITKVGDGQETSVVHGDANIITHIGAGDDYVGAWGKANVVTKVGDGNQVVLAKGDANVVTHIGQGDGYHALWSKANIVTKVGDGTQVTAAKGKANITTVVGDGMSVAASYGDANVHTKVGDGLSVNVAWGKYNLNTKVGDGLNLAVMKGNANANIHMGDGLDISASYARNNINIKVGNGDSYYLAIASSNTKSQKLSSLFEGIKQTVLGVGGSQAINYLVQGDEASTSGSRRGRGAIATPEINHLSGFELESIAPVSTDLSSSIRGQITKVETPNLETLKTDLSVEEQDLSHQPNLITNGDFESGSQGWLRTNGMEVSHSASVYGLDNSSHGDRVTELDVSSNTTLYQEISALKAGEVIQLSFDFAKRSHIGEQEGIEVLWNDQIVFSASDVKDGWQQKDLKLRAQEGTNRISFRATGESNGRGYILDNVIAKSEYLAQNDILKNHSSGDAAEVSALSDKERASEDGQRLAAEKEQQLAKLKNSQRQLESTDQDALSQNGSEQKANLEREAREVRDELFSITDGLEQIVQPDIDSQPTGNRWREKFAGGYLSGIQTQLDSVKAESNEQISAVQKGLIKNRNKLANAVVQSEYGIMHSEKSQADAKNRVDQVKSQADTQLITAQNREKQAKEAKNSAQDAVQNADRETSAKVEHANSKVANAIKDAKSVQQSSQPKPAPQQPDQIAHKPTELTQNSGDETVSTENISEIRPDGRLIQMLEPTEQEELEAGMAAVNRLQINAGSRASKPLIVGDVLSRGQAQESTVVSNDTKIAISRSNPLISGLKLEGLGEVPRVNEEAVLSIGKVMEVRAFKKLANHTGKRRGKSYYNVLRALESYHSADTDYPDQVLTRLTTLRQQLQGYLLGHSDSGRVQAMQTLLSQTEMNLESVVNQLDPDMDIDAKGEFSRLYDQLGNASLKSSEHLYIDGDGRLKLSRDLDAAISQDITLERLQSAVEKEYGTSLSDSVFTELSAKQLAKDGNGVDVSGLKRIHRALEDKIEPVSATLFVWKPSDHSMYGHAALQIGRGRVNVEPDADEIRFFNEDNYVSWWPTGSKGKNPFKVATDDNPDARVRFPDLSLPASMGSRLEDDVASEENDKFGIDLEQNQAKKSEIQAAFSGNADLFESMNGPYASFLLMSPEQLEKSGIPSEVSAPYIEQWSDPHNDMSEVGERFADAIRAYAKELKDPSYISDLLKRSMQDAFEAIHTFKNTEADNGRVFRIHLEGLDAGAMQAEWAKISTNPNARYQLMTQNCSSLVARVLNAGGANKLLGRNSLSKQPSFGVWTPKKLFKFGQDLQQAQLKKVAESSVSQNTPLKKVDRDLLSHTESQSVLTRFFQKRVFGTQDERKQVKDSTRLILSNAISSNEAEKVTINGHVGRLAGYYHHSHSQSQDKENAVTAQKKVVLFLHGPGASAEEQALLVRRHYAKLNVDVMAVNMRGFGASDGAPSEQGFYQDARSMFRYLISERGIKPSNIILHGYSTGAPVAANLARYAAQNDQPVSGLLLDRPIPSMSKAVASIDIANPAGIVASVSKAVMGQFSLQENMTGLSKSTPVMLYTDKGVLGDQGEKIRHKLIESGFHVSGEQTNFGHQATGLLIKEHASEIVDYLSLANVLTEDELKRDVTRLPLAEILDKVVRSLGKSSTAMMESGFYNVRTHEANSHEVQRDWAQTLSAINTIRNLYFPNDMQRYFDALKEKRVGNCGDRALYAAHLIINQYGYKGEVETLRLAGSGDHVFVKVGGNSESAKIVDPWTGQYYPFSELNTFLYNPNKDKVLVHRSFDDLKQLFEGLLPAEAGRAGFREERYNSRDFTLTPLAERENVKLGIPEHDQKTFAEIAEREDVIIGLRPIDEKSKSLIASKQYSSKGLMVKAKSADWGPMSGFIPVKQSFAKASARNNLERFNHLAQQALSSGHAVSVDLILEQSRVNELVDKFQAMTRPKWDPQTGLFKTRALMGGEVADQIDFYLQKVTVDGVSRWQVFEAPGIPMQVIGNPDSRLPMTADYDLFTVMPSIRDLGPQDKVKQPISWQEWKESVDYTELSKKQKAMYDNETLYNRKDGESLGVLSDRIKTLKDIINTGLGREEGYEMVHHGADDANFFSVMGDNFPAAFFLPRRLFAENGLGAERGSIQDYFNVNDQGAVVIRSAQEFSNFQQVAINANYRAAQNSQWNKGLEDPLFTTKRKLSHDYLNARDELAKRFQKPKEIGLESLGPKRKPGLKLNIDTSMTPLERKKREYQQQGLLVASGSFGLVLRDPNDSSVLIKYLGKAHNSALAEAEFFNQFYGEDSASVSRDDNGEVFIRMLKIPGTPVSELAAQDIPSNAQQLYLNMISDLSDANIYHRDLNLSNVMYDAESQRFWPIDFETAESFESGEQFKNYPNDAQMFEKSLHALAQQKLESLQSNKVNRSDVTSWQQADTLAVDHSAESRFDSHVVIQLEDDPVVTKAAANLAGKYASSSVVIQLDEKGGYRVVHGDATKLSGFIRWQIVGHGREPSDVNHSQMSGYSAEQLATHLVKFEREFKKAEGVSLKPDYISMVGCSLVSDDRQQGFAHQFLTSLDSEGIRADGSARSVDVAIGQDGRKYTLTDGQQWTRKHTDHKVVLNWGANGELTTHQQAIKNGIAIGDIDINKIGVRESDYRLNGAISANREIFSAPARQAKNKIAVSASASNQLSYSGNIQVNVGDGEFTSINWGTSNLGIKVGTGGFKSLSFGDNNAMLHIGDGDSKHSVDIAGYTALEGVQAFIGNRNVSFNMGRSNDVIFMMDKSIPTPPLINPFDGSARIASVLQSLAGSSDADGWLAQQDQQWNLSGAKKFVNDMSGIDLSSSVDYATLTELDAHNQRSSRGLKYDAEATLNKKYNQWLSKSGNQVQSGLSRADKLRQLNDKSAFNLAVAGQGADIQVTTGNWNFMFGDNIQSILDTNIGSLFGAMTQQFSATGQARATFTYQPADLPRQLKNRLLGRLAGLTGETTLGDIFGVDYSPSGQLISRTGEPIDTVATLREIIEVMAEFGGEQLKSFADPAKLLNQLKSGIDMGADGIKSFATSHGLQQKTLEEEHSNVGDGQVSVKPVAESDASEDRTFGFNALNLPNLFATIFDQDKQAEMTSLVENLKKNLSEDVLNIKEQTFDFLRSSGHLKGDGDMHVSLGNYNFNWAGDGQDLGAYLGDNNNFWGGRGHDVYYATGISNIFSGDEGNDTGVMMGRENMMFGGEGNDTAVVAGRINHVFLGSGSDQAFIFGEGGEVDMGSGFDYLVTSGNFNRVDAGSGQDYSVTIGSNNQISLAEGDDFARIFGNYNRLNAGTGNDVVKLMGYHAALNGQEGNDHLIAAAMSKFSHFEGGKGRDLMVLGGYQNTFKGGEDTDSFVVSGEAIDVLVADIRRDDKIVFNGVDWHQLWFRRSGYDLELSIIRDIEAVSSQGQFETTGSVLFANYFDNNRADIVLAMSDADDSGQSEYTALTDSAVDTLVQAMSNFEPKVGANGFMDSFDVHRQEQVISAWSDVVSGKTHFT